MIAENTTALSFPDEISGIQSKQDLFILAEVLDISTYDVKRTTFVYLDRNEDAWFGCVQGKRKQDVTVENVKAALGRVPDTTFPLVPTSLTTPLEGSPIYIKRPKLLLLDDDAEAKLLPQMFLDEIRILEFLKHHPHPNVVQYYGCRVKRDRVMAILLKRHEITLQEYVGNGSMKDGVAACLSGIRAGVNHLHSLGLAHNDLNPSNIVLDTNGGPVIIDLGSCKSVGERLVSAGTRGWVDEDYETSEQRHDEVAFKKIEAWLNNQAK